MNTPFNNNLITPSVLPNHVAIIMDGNGRWAKSKNKPRTAGHQAAEIVIMDTIRKSVEIGIKELSLFAFSTENWTRPKTEINFLMNYSRDVISRSVNEIDSLNIKIRWVGSKSKMFKSVVKTLQDAEEKTKKNKKMILNFCINYGGRLEILDAINSLAYDIKAGKLNKKITENILKKRFYSPKMNDVDLLIRTSGEKRISNFLLWQSAYAEIIWIDKMWPDFTQQDLLLALKEFESRNRRFGKV